MCRKTVDCTIAPMPTPSSIELDMDGLVSYNTGSNMVCSSPDGIFIRDFIPTVTGSVGVRANGTWLDLVEHLESAPEYAQRLFFVLLKSCEPQYERARNELGNKMPETFEDLLAVMAGR